MIVEIGAREGIEQVPLQHDQDAQAPEPVQSEHSVRAIHPSAMVALPASTFQRA